MWLNPQVHGTSEETGASRLDLMCELVAFTMTTCMLYHCADGKFKLYRYTADKSVEAPKVSKGETSEEQPVEEQEKEVS